jgi:NDP-sugar pyrophosphorylase family protein
MADKVSESMHVLLLATDEQAKLGPLTNAMPTPLAPIANRPVMAVAVEIVARAGYKDLLVSVYNNGGSIASYFGNGSRWGVQIEYLIQREGWGSAGALAWAAQLLRETVLVLPADSIIDLDIEAALAFHRAHGGLATMILHEPSSVGATHPVQLDERGLVRGIGSAVCDEMALDHTGAFLFEPQILQYIPARTHYDSYHQLVPALQAAGVAVYGYHMQGYWNSLESFQAYQDAQKVFLYSGYDAGKTDADDSRAKLPRVRYPSIEGHQIAPGIWVGQNPIIHPSARLAPPLCIGDGCRIGYGVELGPEVVVGSNVVIDDEASIFQSTVLDRTYVGQLVNINKRVINKTTLIDTQTSESTQVVDPFLLAETRLASGSGWLRHALIVFATLLLLSASFPLILLIGLAIVATSGGSLFSRLPRVGRAATADGQTAVRTFDLLAFRIHGSDGTISRLGYWLHRWELDRIPELWNVLMGDLELVGVKPLLPEEASALTEEWHQKRYECRPGFTGLWYIQTNAESDLEEVLVADAYYAATHTWRDDLRLLWRTPVAWQKRVRSERRQNSKDNDLNGQIDNLTII